MSSLENPALDPVFVSVHRLDGGERLAAPVRSGVVDLSETVHLPGLGGELLARHGAELDREVLARELRAAGAPSDDAAERDAARFLAELTDSGLRAGRPGPRAHPPRGADPGIEIGAKDLERLAREVLARGLRLRYRASGKSMRPGIPHGSWLEAEPYPFESVRRGDVALYCAGEHRLVAHRVIARKREKLLARGDSSLRLDEVGAAEYLGLVRARSDPEGRRVDLTRSWRHWLALALGPFWRAAAFLARHLLVGPLRRSYGGPSVARALLRGLLRVASGSLLALERTARRLRAPLDVARAALLSACEKDRGRRALYRRRTVQGFTSLEENVDAGLTLIEEVCLTRHGLAPGRALVLGCGPGRECLALARRGFTVTGIDREEGMLARARELAREARLAIDYFQQEVLDFRVEGAPFDYVVIFSGLYNMILPRARRVAMLARCRDHLAGGGRVLVTFLSAYRFPLQPPPPRARGFWEAANPEHEKGDLFLLNETVHVLPTGDGLWDEAHAAGLDVEHLFRDQRAYDRAEGRVRGYAILRRPG